MDQDLWLKAVHFHGPLLLQTILSEEDSKSKGEVENDKLNICKFIKSKLPMLLKSCDYTSDASDVLPGHAIPTLPIELFQNSSPVERRDLFFKSLDRGNILILRVINDSLADNFKLLVLCRQDNCMKLDDLSLIMYLPKLEAELEKVEGGLKSDDLIRAAVCSCSIDERKLYVTLDSNILEDETENVQLGKISEADLPSYIGEIDVSPSYVEYLHQSSEFGNPRWSDELCSFLDIKKNYLYSFHTSLDGKEYAPVVCASELKRKQILTISNAQHAKALSYYENGNFTDAFLCLNNALSIYPKNVDALVSRGILYANTNNLRKAVIDVETALKIDSNHKAACKQMSVLLVQAARLHIEQKDFTRAEEALDAALNLDGSNKDAIAASDEIRSKCADVEILDKVSKLDKKARISSNSSDRSDSSSSRKDDLKERQAFLETSTNADLFLEASTKAFLSSLKKKHQHERSRKSHHHHRTHHKSRSKSPKSKSVTPEILK